jgi:hypothetical protein
MKMTRMLLLAALAMNGTGALRAYDPVKGFAHTEVAFFEPENFTDIRDSYTGSSDGARSATLTELQHYLVRQATRYLAPGQKLSITVTDIDLAGDFEPGRGPQWDEIRIVKDIYPPRINLSFRLTDPDGQIVREGKRELRDLAFMMRLTMAFQDDPLRHEKALIDDWLSEEFRAPKKG